MTHRVTIKRWIRDNHIALKGLKNKKTIRKRKQAIKAFELELKKIKMCELMEIPYVLPEEYKDRF